MLDNLTVAERADFIATMIRPYKLKSSKIIADVTYAEGAFGVGYVVYTFNDGATARFMATAENLEIIAADAINRYRAKKFGEENAILARKV